MRKLALNILSTTALFFSLASFASGQLTNVVNAFAEIPSRGMAITFATDGVRVPKGGHWQGAQMRYDAECGRHLLFLSHDSATTAFLYVVAFPQSLDEPGHVLHVHEFPSDGESPPLRHSGGIQLVGDILVVGVEDNQQKTRSEVQFWDVSNPEQFQHLSHLTVRRRGKPKDQTAGAVGLVQRNDDHLLVVANWDSRSIDFYVTNGKPLHAAACQFTFDRRWSDETADKTEWKSDARFGSHQSIQLLTDREGDLFLCGFHTMASGREIIDLFSIDLQQPIERLLRKLASHSITLSDGHRFKYASGLWTDDSRLRVLTSGRNLRPETRLTVTP